LSDRVLEGFKMKGSVRPVLGHLLYVPDVGKKAMFLPRVEGGWKRSKGDREE